MSDHLDLDQLADVLAGELDAPHLAGCATCQASLEAVRAATGIVAEDLAALPPLPAMPDLGASFRAAVASGSTGTPADRATVVPLEQARSRRWLPWSGAAAAAAVVAVGGVLYFQTFPESRSSEASKALQRPTTARTTVVNSTGTNYLQDGKALKAALPALLKGSAEAAASPTQGAAGPRTGAAPQDNAATDGLAGLHDPKNLAACLSSLTEPGDPTQPLALDYARYKGQPALVIVLPSSRPDKVEIWVVGPNCRLADADLKFYARVDAPPD